MSEGISPILMAAKLQRLRTEAAVQRNTEMIYESSRRRKAVEAHKQSVYKLLRGERVLLSTASTLAAMIGEAQNKSDAEMAALFLEVYERNCKEFDASLAKTKKTEIDKYLDQDNNRSVGSYKITPERMAERIRDRHAEKNAATPTESAKTKP